MILELREHKSSIRGRMVDELTRILFSIFLTVDFFFVFVISYIENADSNKYEVENGSEICYDFLFTSEFSFCKEIQNVSFVTHKI